MSDAPQYPEPTIDRLVNENMELRAELFCAENSISNALCSLQANDHQTREILEAARLRIWKARGIELPAAATEPEGATAPKKREKAQAYIDSMPVYPHSVMAVSSGAVATPCGVCGRWDGHIPDCPAARRGSSSEGEP